jgi:hypothetical protein
MWAKRCELPLRGINSRTTVPTAAPVTAILSGKKIDGALQENILTLIVYDTEAVPVVLAAVDISLFESSVYRNIADKAVGYFRKYKKAPADHIADLLEPYLNSTKRSDVRLYRDALHDMHGVYPGLNRQYVLDQLQEFVDRQVCIQAITRAAENARAGDVQGIKAELLKDLERVGQDHSGGLLEGIRPWCDFRKLTFAPVEDALFPILQKPGITQIAACRGDGKTWVGLNMFVGLGSGTDVFGLPCKRPYRCLFHDGELPPWTLQERIEAVIADQGARPKRDMLHVLSAYGNDTTKPINLADPQQTDALVERFSQFEIVFLDNLSALTYGVDLNDAQAWEAINAVSMRCRGNGTSIVRIQHLGKDKSKGGRGSSRQEDPLDVSLVLERQPQDTFHADEVIRITCNKMRNHSMSEFKPIDLQFSKDRKGRIQIAHDHAFHNRTDELAVDIMELMKTREWKKTNKTAFAVKHGIARSTLYLAISKAEETLREQDKETDL